MAAACGNGSTALISELGTALTWRAGKDKGGRGPTRVETHTGPRFLLIASGHRHFAAVCEDGLLHTWGEGEYAQLGHGACVLWCVCVTCIVRSLFHR